MHEDLREQKDYRGGNVPVGNGMWVCGKCQDVPNQYQKRQVLPPDPVPVQNPRPDDGSPSQVIATEDLDPIWTEDEKEIEVT